MKGWKTWLAFVCFLVLAVIDYINGDAQAAMEKISFATALVGLGHKLEKIGR